MAWKLLTLPVLSLGKGCWDQPETLPPPHQQSHSEWLTELKSWRAAHLQGYKGEVYKDPSLTWTRTSFIQPQVHLYDRYLFDGSWTVDRYLDDLENRYGGIDSVLIWPTYTNLGIDERNQFDYFRAVPGGLQALSNVTEAFHQRGVRVLWAYNPWDQATRDEGHHWDVLASLLKVSGGDGFNGDTMKTIPNAFWKAGTLNNYSIAVEPEGSGVPCDDLDYSSAGWTPLGWGYYGHKKADMMTMRYDFAPGVDKMKWLDPQGRHLTHVCDRWSKSRATAIQLAFFNGDGYESWENIWGLFNRLTDRDAELLRRSATLLRWAGKRNFSHDFDDWIPHAPEATDASRGIFASRFEKAGDALWLLINKGNTSYSTVQIPQMFLAKGCEIFDLYHGMRVSPDVDGVVNMSIEPGAVSALLATTRGAEEEMLLQKMAAMTQQPLAAFSPTWQVLQQQMDPRPSTKAFEHPPPDMVLLPRMKFNFDVSGTEFEGGCDPADDPNRVCCKSEVCKGAGAPNCQCGVVQLEYFGVDVQFPWESQPERNHRKQLDLGPLLFDRDLVTNADYLRYLNASGYKPTDKFNFLKHWVMGRPKPGDEQKPVVNIGFEEAQAFCQFYGKRLPHSYEWQLAAQGQDGRRYPWGNDWDPSVVPPPGHDPVSIGQYEKGISVFGVRDLIGNVWQYTDSFRDDHTRAVLLRGSSRYNPEVSEAFPSIHQSVNWYFPPARELNRHSKYFLMSNSYERAGTLGFRCAADVVGGPPAPHHYWNSDGEVLKFV
ncbi:SUMF2 [Symbiodinium pilosum]|uniref:SUMF2 protein n=1 Tax=Symbiodinium pilosum TaxID=2952 RepID=A0A812PET9_SYMPI|nr:SUMF2 [Symbiodinium pilosum]